MSNLAIVTYTDTLEARASDRLTSVWFVPVVVVGVVVGVAVVQGGQQQRLRRRRQRARQPRQRRRRARRRAPACDRQYFLNTLRQITLIDAAPDSANPIFIYFFHGVKMR